MNQIDYTNGQYHMDECMFIGMLQRWKWISWTNITNSMKFTTWKIKSITWMKFNDNSAKIFLKHGWNSTHDGW
jgi:hypothetical protein